MAITLADERRPSTAALDEHIARRWEEALARARREQRALFDGPILRWLRFRRAGAAGLAMPAREVSALEVVVGPGTFREFVATNLDPGLQPDVAADPQLGAIPWSHFGNAVGTSAIVLTRDRRVVAGRRSERVYAFSGHVHAFGGLLEAAAGAIDPFASMRRELTEELGLAAAELRDLTALGAVVEPRIHQPEFLFALRVDLTVEQLRARWSGADSRAEHVALVDLPDDARALEEALRRLAPVTPIARACLDLHFARAARPS